MNKIAVDESKCIHCGMCIRDCVVKCLEFDENKIPCFANAGICISCQHCLSICPQGAISFNDKNPENSGEISKEDMLSLMRSRRSIRQYKNEELSEDELKKLKDMLSCTPTGINSHSLHFSIVEKKEVMRELSKKCSARFLKIFKSPLFKPFAKKFEFYKNAFERGEDIIFRGAPHMIVASSSLKAPCRKEDAIIALSYFELYAASLDIGTCWCGYAQMCLEKFPDLSEILEIPDGHKPVYVILFGKPAVKYSRLPQPEPYRISEIKEFPNKKYGFLKLIKRFILNNLP